MATTPATNVTLPEGNNNLFAPQMTALVSVRQAKRAAKSTYDGSGAAESDWISLLTAQAATIYVSPVASGFTAAVEVIADLVLDTNSDPDFAASTKVKIGTFSVSTTDGGFFVLPVTAPYVRITGTVGKAFDAIVWSSR